MTTPALKTTAATPTRAATASPVRHGPEGGTRAPDRTRQEARQQEAARASSCRSVLPSRRRHAAKIAILGPRPRVRRQGARRSRIRVRGARRPPGASNVTSAGISSDLGEFSRGSRAISANYRGDLERSRRILAAISEARSSRLVHRAVECLERFGVEAGCFAPRAHVRGVLAQQIEPAARVGVGGRRGSRDEPGGEVHLAQTNHAYLPRRRARRAPSHAVAEGK